MKTTIFGLGAVLLLLVAAAPAVNVAYDSAGTPEPVVNESVTVDYNNTVAVDADGARYSEDITVRADETTLDAGTDYSWDAHNGTIAFANTSATTSDDSVDVTYDVYRRSAATEQFATIFGLGGRIAAFVVLAIGIGIVLKEISGGSSF